MSNRFYVLLLVSGIFLHSFAAQPLRRVRLQTGQELARQKERLVVASKKRIGVLGDVESSWEKIRTWNEKSNIFTIVNDNLDNFDIVFNGDNTEFVFMGDAIDKGRDTIKALKFFIYLKEKYPHRVHLILGNRDINKLRFLWELSDEALVLNGENRFSPDRFRIEEWEDLFAEWCANGNNTIDGEVVAYQHGKSADSDRLLKFKFLLDKTLGCSDTFKNFKKEVCANTDQETFDIYMSLLAEKGLLSKYLLHTQLIHKDANKLYVHGSLHEDSFGYIVGEHPYRMTIETEEGLEEYVETMNKAGAEAIRAGLKGNLKEAIPLVELQEPKVIKNKQGKNGWGRESNPYSIIQGKPWQNGDLALLSPQFAALLSRVGITMVFSGHIPVGDFPVALVTQVPDHDEEYKIQEQDVAFARGKKVTCVLTDTSFAKPPRNAGVVVEGDEINILGDYYSADGVKHPVTCYSSDPKVGKQTVIDGALWWLAGRTGNGQELFVRYKDQRSTYKLLEAASNVKSDEVERLEDPAPASARPPIELCELIELSPLVNLEEKQSNCLLQ